MFCFTHHPNNISINGIFLQKERIISLQNRNYPTVRIRTSRSNAVCCQSVIFANKAYIITKKYKVATISDYKNW